MGTGKGTLFVTGECQLTNVEGGWKKKNLHLANITAMIDEDRSCQWVGGGLMKNKILA